MERKDSGGGGLTKRKEDEDRTVNGWEHFESWANTVFQERITFAGVLIRSFNYDTA